MKNLETPVYLKTDPDMPWPKDKLFYILSADGLMLCRNHEWFQSCAQAKHGPSELESQKPFVKLCFPKIRKALIEKALSFFRAIEQSKHSECALAIVWNRQSLEMELLCPDQKASSWAVEYELPNLPRHLSFIGDIHSHCNSSAAPSFTDEKDETARPGLHVVIGCVLHNQPDFSCCAVIDGCRFKINNLDEVLEQSNYGPAEEAPAEWIAKVKPKYQSYGYGGGSYGSEWSWKSEPSKADLKRVKEILGQHRTSGHKPDWYNLKQELFRETKQASLVWCEDTAQAFVKQWEKDHEEEKTP